MAFGIPSTPPMDPQEFQVSLDDETCPNCGWDREDATADHNAAFNAGVLLAVELAEQAIFTAMAGTQLVALYWRCPKCQTPFVTEEELTMGAMS